MGKRQQRVKIKSPQTTNREEKSEEAMETTAVASPPEFEVSSDSGDPNGGSDDSGSNGANPPPPATPEDNSVQPPAQPPSGGNGPNDPGSNPNSPPNSGSLNSNQNNSNSGESDPATKQGIVVKAPEFALTTSNSPRPNPAAKGKVQAFSKDEQDGKTTETSSEYQGVTNSIVAFPNANPDLIPEADRDGVRLEEHHKRFSVNDPDDEFEKEADQVARAVINGTGPSGIRSGSSGIQRLTNEKEVIHPHPGNQISKSAKEKLKALNGVGEPLPKSIKMEMEGKMGYSFAQVRVHRSASAAELADELHARAFTYGPNLVFNRGQFDPISPEGRFLIAHELTHVIQQGEASSFGLEQNSQNGDKKLLTPENPEGETTETGNEEESLTQEKKTPRNKPNPAEKGRQTANIAQNKSAEEKQNLQSKLENRSAPLKISADILKDKNAKNISSQLRGGPKNSNKKIAQTGIPTLNQVNPSPAPAQSTEVRNSVKTETGNTQTVNQATEDGFQILANRPTKEKVFSKAQMAENANAATGKESQQEEESSEVGSGSEATNYETKSKRHNQKTKQKSSLNKATINSSRQPKIQLKRKNASIQRTPLGESTNINSESPQNQSSPAKISETKKPNDSITNPGEDPAMDATRSYRGTEISQQSLAADDQVSTKQEESEIILNSDHGQYSIYPTHSGNELDLESMGAVSVDEDIAIVADYIEEVEKEVKEAENKAQNESDRAWRKKMDEKQADLDQRKGSSREKRGDYDIEKKRHSQQKFQTGQQESRSTSSLQSLKNKGESQTRESEQLTQKITQTQQKQAQTKQKASEGDDPEAQSKAAELQSKVGSLSAKKSNLSASNQQVGVKETQEKVQSERLDSQSSQQNQTDNQFGDRYQNLLTDENSLWEEQQALTAEIAAGPPQHEDKRGGGSGGGGAAPPIDQAREDAIQAIMEELSVTYEEAEEIYATRQEEAARQAFLSDEIGYDSASVLSTAITENANLLSQFTLLTATLESEALAAVAETISTAESEAASILESAEASAETAKKSAEKDAENAIKDADSQADSCEDPGEADSIRSAGKSAAQSILSSMKGNVASIISTAQQNVKTLLADAEKAVTAITGETQTAQSEAATESSNASETLASTASEAVSSTVATGIEQLNIPENIPEFSSDFDITSHLLPVDTDAYIANLNPSIPLEDTIGPPDPEPDEDPYQGMAEYFEDMDNHLEESSNNEEKLMSLPEETNIPEEVEIPTEPESPDSSNIPEEIELPPEPETPATEPDIPQTPGGNGDLISNPQTGDPTLPFIGPYEAGMGPLGPTPQAPGPWAPGTMPPSGPNSPTPNGYGPWQTPPYTAQNPALITPQEPIFDPIAHQAELDQLAAQPTAPLVDIEQVRQSFIDAQSSGFMWSANEDAMVASISGLSPEQGRAILSDPVIIAGLNEHFGEHEVLNILEDLNAPLEDKINATMANFAGDNEAIIALATVDILPTEQVAMLTDPASMARLNQNLDQTTLLTMIAGMNVPLEVKQQAAAGLWPDNDEAQSILELTQNFNAGAVAMDVRGSVNGGGTNESQLFSAIHHRSPTEIALMSANYRKIYGRDMTDDIKGDLSGEDEVRALAALSGDPDKEDAAALYAAMHGGGTDEDLIMETLRNKSPQEIEALEAQFAADFEDMPDLRDWMESEMGGHNYDQAIALMDSNTEQADAIAIDDAMNGGFMGWGTDEESIESIYARNAAEIRAAHPEMTTAEVEAEIRTKNDEIETQYNSRYDANGNGTSLDSAYSDEMDDAQLDLINSMASYDHAGMDAAKVEMATNVLFWRDNDAVHNVLEDQYARAQSEETHDFMLGVNEMAQQNGWTPEETAAFVEANQGQLTNNIDTAATQNMDGLDSRFEQKYAENWTQPNNSATNNYPYGPNGPYIPVPQSGSSALSIAASSSNRSDLDNQQSLELIENNGHLSDAQKVYYSVAGVGTDEQALQTVLDNKTDPEIQTMRDEYNTTHPDGDFDTDIMNDVSGRDEFDLSQKLEGTPQNEEELRAQMQRLVEFEASGWGSDLFADEEREVMLDRENEKLEAGIAFFEAKETNPDSAETAMLSSYFAIQDGYMDTAVAQHRTSVDTATNYAATAAGIVATIAIVAASGGLAGVGIPALLPALQGMSAAQIGVLTSLAAGATTMGTKSALLGDAYGQEDIALDAGLMLVDMATAGLSSGMADEILKGSSMLSGMAQSDDLATRLTAHFLSNAGEGAITSVPNSLIGSLANEQTWDADNPLFAIMENVGKGGLQNAGMGGIMGMWGGVDFTNSYLTSSNSLSSGDVDILLASNTELPPSTLLEISAKAGDLSPEQLRTALALAPNLEGAAATELIKNLEGSGNLSRTQIAEIYGTVEGMSPEAISAQSNEIMAARYTDELVTELGLSEVEVQIFRKNGVDPNSVRNLQENGLDPELAAVAASENGAAAVDILATYSAANTQTQLGMGESVINTAANLGRLDDVNTILSTGMLDNPNQLLTVLSRIDNGDLTAIAEFDDALGRIQAGHQVSFGPFGDVVDHTSMEIIQHRTFSGANEVTFVEGVNSAMGQAGGKIPEGYARVVQVSMLNPDSPNFNASGDELTSLLMDYPGSMTMPMTENGRLVDMQIQITNGTGTHSIASDQIYQGPSGRVWNDPQMSVAEFALEYATMNPNSEVPYEQLASGFASGQRMNPLTGNLEFAVSPIHSLDDIGLRYGADVSAQVQRIADTNGIPIESAVNVVNMHGRSGVDLMTNFENGLDFDVASGHSGVPADWIEAAVNMTGTGDMVIALRDTNPLLKDLRGSVLPKAKGHVSFGPYADMEITSIPKVDAAGNEVHPPFKTNDETGLVEMVMNDENGLPQRYVVVGEIDENGAVIEKSYQVRPLADVWDADSQTVSTTMEGLRPMGPDIDPYFFWQRSPETGNYVNLASESGREMEIRDMLGGEYTADGIPHITHGPYMPWAATLDYVSNTRGEGLVAVDGRALWIPEEQLHAFYDLYGVPFAHGEQMNGFNSLTGNTGTNNANGANSGGTNPNLDSPDSSSPNLPENAGSSSSRPLENAQNQNLPPENVLNVLNEAENLDLPEPTAQDLVLIDRFSNQMADPAMEAQFDNLLQADSLYKEVIVGILPNSEGGLNPAHLEGPDAAINTRINADRSTTYLDSDGNAIATRKQDGSVILTPSEGVVWQVDPQGNLLDVSETFASTVTNITGDPHTPPTRRQADFEAGIQDKGTDLSPGTVEALRHYNQLYPSAGKSLDSIIEDINSGKVLNERSRKFEFPKEDGVRVPYLYETDQFIMGDYSSNPNARASDRQDLLIPHDDMAGINSDIEVYNLDGELIDTQNMSTDEALETLAVLRHQHQAEAASIRQRYAHTDNPKGYQDDPEYRQHMTRMVNYSHQSGEAAGAGVMHATLPESNRMRTDTSYAGGTGEFDSAYQNGADIYLVESKGGESQLGGLTDSNGRTLKQGSFEYGLEIIAKMENDAVNNSDSELHQSARDMFDALVDGNLHYVSVRQSFDSNGNLVSHATLNKFTLQEIHP